MSNVLNTNETACKIILSTGEVLFDATGVDVDASKVAEGYKFIDRTGKQGVGTSKKDVDSSECTATADDILAPSTAAVKGQVITGRMTNNGSDDVEVSTSAGSAIPRGFYDGGGKAKIAQNILDVLTPGNLKAGVHVPGLEIDGTYSGEAITAQAKTVSPTFAEQTVQPDAGTDYLSSVTVEAIKVTKTLASTGGYIVTIG